MNTTASENNNNNNNNNNKEEEEEEDEEEEEVCYAYAYMLLNCCTLPMVMKVAVKIGVLQMIHDHQSSSTAAVNGLSPTAIAAGIKATNPDAPAMLDRMLRLLATYSVVRCTPVPTDDGATIERRYSPSPLTKFLLPNDDDNVSLAALLNLQTDLVFLESWSKLDEAIIRGGSAFNMVHGMNVFEYASVDKRFSEVLNDGMYQATTTQVKKILDKYKGFENNVEGVVVDVGGGVGHTLRIITSKYTSIRAINFDLPHVISNALPCPGVEHVSGDMFERIPEGDVIFMKWVLHDWSDENCKMILKNCHKALPKEGKVIVVEAIMEDEALSTDSSKGISQMDVHMMAQTSRGKERSRKEFEALAKATGFSTVNFDCCICNLWVMEFFK